MARRPDLNLFKDYWQRNWGRSIPSKSTLIRTGALRRGASPAQYLKALERIMCGLAINGYHYDSRGQRRDRARSNPSRRRNPWASAKPASWNSMSRAQRKAWNRANWQRGGGSKPAAKRKIASPSMLTPRNVRNLSQESLVRILNHPERVSKAVYAAADLAFNGDD